MDDFDQDLDQEETAETEKDEAETGESETDDLGM